MQYHQALLNTYILMHRVTSTGSCKDKSIIFERARRLSYGVKILPKWSEKLCQIFIILIIDFKVILIGQSLSSIGCHVYAMGR